jgi:hypothetical protein
MAVVTPLDVSAYVVVGVCACVFGCSSVAVVCTMRPRRQLRWLALSVCAALGATWTAGVLTWTPSLVRVAAEHLLYAALLWLCATFSRASASTQLAVFLYALARQATLLLASPEVVWSRTELLACWICAILLLHALPYALLWRRAQIELPLRNHRHGASALVCLCVCVCLRAALTGRIVVFVVLLARARTRQSERSASR